MAKRDLARGISTAAHAAPGLEDRFARAEQTLAERPTGYSATHQPPVTHAGLDDTHPYHAVVPVSEIDENPFNARRIYRQVRIEKLAVSIAKEKQLVPGIATVRGGRYILAAGHYRLRSIRFAGLPTIEVMVHHNLTDQQLYEISLKENDERDDQSALDNALAWRDLLDKKVYPDESTLAAAIGKSAPNVNKTLAILKLSADVVDLIKQDPAAFALSSLYELTLLEKVAGQAAALSVANKMLAGDIGRKEIQEMRARAEAPHLARKKKETSRQYRILNDGQPIGTIKDFDDGRVKLEVKFDDVEQRQEVVAFLKDRFNLH
jgi:ParB family chromosome partitioning protein